jgi:DNA-binding beta-propeller fold protein YncE
MPVLRWIGVLGAVAAMLATVAGRLDAQSVTTNPFRPIVNWGELPAGRSFGSTSAVEIAADGNVWVVERCGANTCVGSNVDPVLLFTKDGKLVRSFGAGKIAWPHGVDVDAAGNLWVTDAWAEGATTTGHAVLKFNPEGELLMTLGEPGMRGDPPRRLTRPSDVLVAPNGEIYVVEAHDQSQNRITKWRADGTYIETWGETGYGPKQFRDPHALAMDSQGRLFVGDRYNNRIQIFDQTGKFLAIWTQFGRPSGIFIDKNDRIYVADSESSPAPDEYMGMRNAGWEKGIRIGDAKTGWVSHFIPDDRVNVTGYSGPEGIAVDDEGNLYGAEVTQRRVVKWVRFRP